MPRYYPGPLGTPIGKLKDAVVRCVNGKLFYSIRPEKYNISQSPEAKNSRTAFAVTVQFARRVASISQLAHFWKKAKVKGTSAYQRILKYNLPLTGNGFLTAENKMLPLSPGIDIKARLDSSLSLMFNIDLSGSELVGCTGNISLHYIIALSAAAKKTASFDFIEKTELIDKKPVNGYLEIMIEASNSDRTLFKRFNKFLLFIVITAIGPDGKNLCAAGKTSEFVFNNDSRKFLENA